MKVSMKLALFVVLALTGLAIPASADTFIVGCNTKGLDKMSSAQFARVFWNRVANNGKGNGGESADVLVNLVTGDVTVTCVQTADEDTGGTLSVQLPDNSILVIGTFFPEADPNVTP